MAYLSAALAHVRLLAGVDTLMDSQGRTLNELLATGRIVADVGTNAAMDAFYESQCDAFDVAAQAFLP